MKKLSFSIALSLMGYYAMAQTDYLVTSKSDTIKGKVRILSYDKIDRAQVTVNDKGKKETFTALQVLSVHMDNEFFKAIQLENTVRLMKVIKTGYLSLYAFKLPNQSSYDGRYMVKMDGSTLEVPNMSFKKMMSKFLEDCTELSEKIKKGELGKADVNAILEEYNVCVTQLKPVTTSTPAATEQLEAIQNLSNKIKELNFDAKQDALDILKDIQSKVEKKEKVSNYLMGGLENALKEQPSLTEDLNKLMELLKK